MSKVLMIVQNDFVNDSRIIKEASILAKNGYDVKVLALHNNDLLEQECIQGFKVKRIKLYTRNRLGKNEFIQAIKYLEFKKKCKEEALSFLPDIVHCHDVYTLPIGEEIVKKIRKIKNVKFVYDSHELWPEASNNLSMPKILLNIQNMIEGKIIRKCDKVITVSESIVNYLKEKYNLGEYPVLLRNIPYKHSSIENRKLFHKELNIEENKKIVIYQGVIGSGRGIENLIKAMKYTNENIVLVLLGNGNKVDEYKNIVIKNELQNKIYFHEAVDPSVLIKYTSSADLGMSMIMNICLSYYYSLPNKMFEYIQSEIPVICSNYPDMSEIISKYNVGEVANADSYNDIAESINKILSDEDICQIYKNNCKLAKKQLNWEEESKKLINLYNEL
ncbi:glycosyltransferase family 4 protein [Haloimpatiens massiliensis]|uniref:glycosyltransferase family 4 protein n=1 Tax=Haloimpatiens massiliensis TaxID=1658110 RepID=UPI000C85C533|nr:glycosyltransferase family 4 protein [Haloimpatiens massiliensis]